jgi:hypothetical protein
MSMQVLPTAPSPTVTHFMNLEALILHRPLLLLGPALYLLFLLLLLPPPLWLVWMEKTRTRREMESVCCGRGRREGGREGALRSGGGDKWREARQEGGERVAEEAVSTPERWFLPPGNEPSQAKPSQEMEDGWRAGEAVGWVETKRGAHGVRAHHFPLYDSCIISIPINPNLIPLLLRRNVMMAQTVRGRHGPESSLLPQ